MNESLNVYNTGLFHESAIKKNTMPKHKNTTDFAAMAATRHPYMVKMISFFIVWLFIYKVHFC